MTNMVEFVNTKLVLKEIRLVRTRRDQLKKEQARLRVKEHRLQKLLEAAQEAQRGE